MSKDEPSDTNTDFNQLKTNPILQRAQSNIEPIKRRYFYNDSQTEEENDTTMEQNISIQKMMTSPLRKSPDGKLTENGNNLVSTPKKTEFKTGREQDVAVSLTQYNESRDDIGATGHLNSVGNQSTVSVNEGRMYNRHTPDLNRIIKYRKSSTSPGKNLLDKFKADQESISFSDGERTEPNIATSITNIEEETYPDIADNLAFAAAGKPSNIQTSIGNNIIDGEVTNLSYNHINSSACSSPSTTYKTTDYNNNTNTDIENFKENLKRQLENPSDGTDTPVSQRSINIFQSPDNKINSSIPDNNRGSFLQNGQFFSEIKDARTEQNRETDNSYNKCEIIYSLESRHDKLETLNRQESVASQTQNNGTIIFDSQSNKRNFENQIFETQGNDTIQIDSQSDNHVTPIHSSSRNGLDQTQLIPSTLTFSADVKFNELLESQRSSALNNHDRNIEGTQPVLFKETQPIINKEDYDKANMDTQPIAYNNDFAHVVENTQPIISSNSITDNADSKPSTTEPQIETNVLSEANASSNHFQTNNANQRETVIHSDLMNPTEEIQVPRTSSPEKRSSPSKQSSNIFSPELTNDTFKSTRVTVTLDVPRIPDITYGTNSIDLQEQHGEIIESDMDETQDLPEIDDNASSISTKSEAQPVVPSFFEKAFKLNTDGYSENEQNNSTANFTSQNSEVDDSQKIVVSRRATKRKLETVTLSEQEEPSCYQVETLSDQSSPPKILIKNGITGVDDKSNDDDRYPSDYRTSDPDHLTKYDINFKNAVWCVYDMDLRHYPGILLNVDEESDACVVMFDTERYTGRMEDISYLDIRIGDIVQDENNILYKVCGLQCLRKDPEIIRCIRGYDTVELEKVNQGNKENHILRALADIRVTIESWAERSKIQVPFFGHSDSSSIKNEQHSTRRQTRTQTTSPRKSARVQKLNYAESDGEKDSFKSELEYTNTLLIELSTQLGKASRKIFDKCIFVLTGISPLEKGLKECIREGGGKILKSDFIELFDFEKMEKSNDSFKQYHLELKLKAHIDKKDYRFACILSERHSRSVKYLQTLALGWPTLHWNFIEACVRNDKVSPNLIYEYLLPSGVSFRLGPMCDERKGPVLSNDIFSFYSNFLQEASLKEQVGLKSNILDGYTIIFCGSLNLDNLLRFYFAALGASQLIHTSTIKNLLETSNSFLDDYMNQDDATMSKLIIFINEKEKGINKVIKNTRKILTKRYRTTQKEYHVEAKEWLIQTLINRNHRFDQYFYRDS
ncbi:DNA repair protein Rad9p [Monosporozyma servazzii]